VARSPGCQRPLAVDAGGDDAAIGPPLGFGRVIILPEALADIRRPHRMPEAEAVARLRALQPKGGAAIEATALRLAQRVRATPPGPLSAESFRGITACRRPKASP